MNSAVLLSLLVVLGFAPSWADLLGISQQGFIDRCIKEHNKARSSVQPAATHMQDMVGRACHICVFNFAVSESACLKMFPFVAGTTNNNEILRKQWCGCVISNTTSKVKREQRGRSKVEVLCNDFLILAIRSLLFCNCLMQLTEFYWKQHKLNIHEYAFSGDHDCASASVVLQKKKILYLMYFCNFNNLFLSSSQAKTSDLSLSDSAH